MSTVPVFSTGAAACRGRNHQIDESRLLRYKIKKDISGDVKRRVPNIVAKGE